MKAVKSEPIINDFLDKTYDDGETPWQIDEKNKQFVEDMVKAKDAMIRQPYRECVKSRRHS